MSELWNPQQILAVEWQRTDNVELDDISLMDIETFPWFSLRRRALPPLYFSHVEILDLSASTCNTWLAIQKTYRMRFAIPEANKRGSSKRRRLYNRSYSTCTVDPEPLCCIRKHHISGALISVGTSMLRIRRSSTSLSILRTVQSLRLIKSTANSQTLEDSFL